MNFVLILLAVAAHAVPAPQRARPDMLVTPKGWRDVDGAIHRYRGGGEKTPLAAACEAAPDGALIEVEGSWPELQLQTGNPAGRHSAYRDEMSFTLRAKGDAVLEHVTLGAGHGDIAFEGFSFEPIGREAVIGNQGTYADAIVSFIDCSFGPGVYWTKWPIRFHGPRGVRLVRCQLAGGGQASEHGLYVDNATFFEVIDCTFVDFPRTALQYTVRPDSGPPPKGAALVRNSKAVRCGSEGGGSAYAFTFAGGPPEGITIERSSAINCDGGGLWVGKDYKQQQLGGSPLDPWWQRPVLGPGYMYPGDVAALKVTIEDFRCVSDNGFEGVKIDHTAGLTLRSTPRKGFQIDVPRIGISLNLVEGVSFESREDPSEWAIYAAEPWRPALEQIGE